MVAGVTTEAQAVVKRDLCRLARFGANISDAHSCFIFLPTALFSRSQERTLSLVGFHSLAQDAREGSSVPIESGLIGWVSKHGRSIHVSPFEQESKTLGVYQRDHDLKSFIGVPVNLSFLAPDADFGVIACDSKKTYAFSKLQGKLLEDLAAEVSNTLKLIVVALSQDSRENSWREFVAQAETLLSTLGTESLDAVRLRITQYEVLERNLGAGRAVELVEQVIRLVQQAVPPHLPSTRMPNGDLLFFLDSMMVGFYENKIRAICDHVSIDGFKVTFEFSKATGRGRRKNAPSIESLATEALGELVTGSNLVQQRGFGYEYRRA